MADQLFEAMRGGAPTAGGRRLLRLDPLDLPRRESIRSRSPAASRNTSTAARAKTFGDLGPLLAAEIRARVERWARGCEPSIEGIRATVVGASQYTIQVSGSTIYVAPLDALPLRNVPVIAPACRSTTRRSIPPRSRARSRPMLKRLDLDDGEQPVAVFVPWRGSATFQRLDAFCRGVVDGLATRAGATAIRWCWPATATSAACSASTCARR